MRRTIFYLFSFIIFLFLLIPDVNAGGLISISPKLGIKTVYSDNSDLRLYTLQMQEEGQDEVQINTIKFRFKGTGVIAPLGIGDVYNIKLYYTDNTPIDILGKSIGNDGTVTFNVNIRILKNNRKDVYITGKIHPFISSDFFQIEVLDADVTAVGIVTSTAATIQGGPAISDQIRVQSGLPDLGVTELTWKPTLIKVTSPDFYAGDRPPTEPGDLDPLDIDFTATIFNKADVRVNLKGIRFALSVGAEGNRKFIHTFVEDEFVPKKGSFEYEFTVGPTFGVRQNRGRYTLVTEIDYNNALQELDEDNNTSSFYMDVTGNDHVQAEKNPFVKDGTVSDVGSTNELLASLRFIASDAPGGAKLTGFDLKLMGCPVSSLSKLVLEGNAGETLHSLDAVDSRSMLKLRFPSQQIVTYKYTRFNLKGNFVGECPKGSYFQVEKIYATVDTSKNKFPIKLGTFGTTGSAEVKKVTDEKGEETIVDVSGLKEIKDARLIFGRSSVSKASTIVHEGMKNIDISDFVLFSSDIKEKYSFGGVTVLLKGCNVKNSIRNIRFVERSSRQTLATVEDFDDNYEAKLSFSPLFLTKDFVYDFSIRVDINGSCAGPFFVAVSHVETNMSISHLEFPILGNEMKTQTTVAPTHVVETEVVVPEKKDEVKEVPKKVEKKYFAYNQNRGSIHVEGEKAQELILELRKWFDRPNVPIHRRFWHYYVNAYVYGGYTVEALARSVVFGGKTVHPTIPWGSWKNSKDYKEYMSKDVKK